MQRVVPKISTLLPTLVGASVLVLAVGCGGKSAEGDGGDAEELLEPLAPISGVQPGNAGGDGGGVTPLPDLGDQPPSDSAGSGTGTGGDNNGGGNSGGGDDPPAPPPVVQVYFQAGFMAQSFADDTQAVDGFSGWATKVSPAVVVNQIAMTTEFLVADSVGEE